MPDKQADGKDKARLFSVYLPPWVLGSRFAAAEVPHIKDLASVPKGPDAAVLRSRRRLFGKMAPPDAAIRCYLQSWLQRL